MAISRIAAGLIIPALVLLPTSRLAIAEVFVLTNGNRLTGELLNPDELPREKYVVRIPSGGQITLDRSQVKQVLERRPELVEYEKIRPRYPDTVEGQWALAQWCQEHRLYAERQTHLKRIIELDPEHVQARQLLGYSKDNGKWATQEEIMTQRGYQRYKGRWRTAQEIELLEKNQKVEEAEKDWAQKLTHWRRWLGTDRDGEGRGNIVTVKDPHAVKALARLLQTDSSAHARRLYIDALANIGTPDAIKTLAVCSIEDPDSEVRLTCLDYLEKQPRPDVVAYYVGKLRSKNNRIVNLAAVGLNRMKDPSSVGPLIDALTTTHKIKVKSGNPGAVSTTFPTGGSRGGAGIAMNPRPKVYTRQVLNQPVLDALVALTGVNFGFNERAWKSWHASQRKRVEVDTRRD
jgi:hypothetical protein